MRREILFLCAALLAAGAVATAVGAETQVRVEKGKVEAESAKGAVTVEAGQKAVLAEGRAPARIVDEPIVRDVMTLYKWAKDETAESKLKTTHYTASVVDYRDESRVRFAMVVAVPNLKDRSVDVWHWQQTPILASLLVYDIEGNLLEYEKTPIGEEAGVPIYSLDIRLRKPVAPGEMVELIRLQEGPAKVGDTDLLARDGKLWKARGGNMSPLSINYNEAILPRSAILVCTNTPVFSSFVRDGATAYVMRKVNGEYTSNPDNDGEYQLTFLWPEKDGTRLEDAGADNMIPAAATAAATAELPSGKTEVSVSQGKVEAETEKAAVTVEAGQKSVLRAGRAPATLPDSPLVKDVMVMYGWATAEKAAGSVKVDAVVLSAMEVLDESSAVAVVVVDHRNVESKAVDVLHWGPTGIPDTWKIHDMEGHLLTVDMRKHGRDSLGFDTYDVDIHLARPVAPGESVSLIQVMQTPTQIGGIRLLWRDGKLWKLGAGNESKSNLNYYEIVLPESAILVDSTVPLMTVDERSGKTAIVIRNLTDERALGRYEISFLWPDKDGTTLADVPEELRKKGMTFEPRASR